MHIHVIDNSTLQLQELLDELAQSANKVTSERFNNTDFSKLQADLVILTGNSGVPYGTQKEAFDRELEFIRHTNIPIIGICFGMKMIVYAFGGTSEVMKIPEHGILQINVVNNDPIFRGKKIIEVYESHKSLVREHELGNVLVPLAVSKDGVEVLRHPTKSIYGFQFHPEVHKDRNEGYLLLKNAIIELINRQESTR